MVIAMKMYILLLQRLNASPQFFHRIFIINGTCRSQISKNGTLNRRVEVEVIALIGRLLLRLGARV